MKDQNQSCLLKPLAKNDQKISQLKLETIQELRNIFEAERERTTNILNKISNERQVN